MTIRSLVGASTGIDQSRFSILSANPGVLNGDFESIATVTVGSGGASSISFSSIPGTYQHLQVRMLARGEGSGNSDYGTNFRMNGVGSSGNYVTHRLYGNGSSALASADTSTTSYSYSLNYNFNDNTLLGFAASVIDILDYATTDKNKVCRMFSGHDQNGSGAVSIYSMMLMQTAAITSISFAVPGGGAWQQHSTAALYGIKAP